MKHTKNWEEKLILDLDQPQPLLPYFLSLAFYIFVPFPFPSLRLCP